jgi:hypothetical protein
MEQLSLIPVCEVHGELKVLKDRARKGKRCLHWECLECARARARRYANGHVEENKARLAAWRSENRGRRNAQARDYHKANPLPQRAASQRFRAANPGKQLEYNNRRRFRLKGAQPDLDPADTKIVVSFYRWAKSRGLSVDHIQPLVLGGAHAPWNMQLLSKLENSTKRASRPTLREVLRGERRYRLLRFMYEQRASSVGAAA